MFHSSYDSLGGDCTLYLNVKRCLFSNAPRLPQVAFCLLSYILICTIINNSISLCYTNYYGPARHALTSVHGEYSGDQDTYWVRLPLEPGAGGARTHNSFCDSNMM